VGGDTVPRVKHADLLDSFAPGETIVLTGTDLAVAGKPVLPLLTYDLTLTDTQLLGGAGRGIPEPRGVRLLSATMLPELNDFNPHVTTITTDTTFAQQQDDPTMTRTAAPDQPYTFLRTAVGTSTPTSCWSTRLSSGPAGALGSLLLASPAGVRGQLLDPNSAIRRAGDTTPPEISDVSVSLPQLLARQVGMRRSSKSPSGQCPDEGGKPLDVSLTYTNDGQHSAPLSNNNDGQFTG
jgi:hypothetical protein